MNRSLLSARERAADLAALANEEFDVLVVGGGVVGAGAAVDAATRGLSVGLVEAQDWASGTSSRSTKLIHGGLRYLQMLDFYLVHEALKERGLLLTHLAPHLVTKMPFVYPLRHRVYERAYTIAAISLYDALAWSTARKSVVPRQRQISRRELYEASPGLRPGAFVGGIEYYDAQVDDARFVVTLVRTAASFGAVAVNRTSAVGIERRHGRVVGARLRDVESGSEFVARARSVILATGVWAEEAEALAGSEHSLRVRPSKGIHLVVAREKIALSSAVVTQTEKSLLFVIPWGEHWIVGTTDTPWEYDKVRPVATATDIDYVLTRVNLILSEPLVLDDVEAAYAGLRPLVAGPGKDTAKLPRDHAVGIREPGLVAISGGKYTTYRIMAKDAVDAAVAGWRNTPRSVTESTPLIGASAVAALENQRERLASRYGLEVDQISRLLGRYGTLLDEVLAPGHDDPSLLEPLVGGPGYLRAEALYGVTHEGALHVEDVLRRRLRLDWETRDRGVESLEAVVAIIGEVLGWSEGRRAEESSRYRQLVEAELAAERQRDDATAAKIMSSLDESTWGSGLAW